MPVTPLRFARAGLAALLLLARLAAQSGEAAAPALARPATEPSVPWNVLIYAAIDNDAEEDGNFFDFLDGVRANCADDPGVRVLLFADRSAAWSSNSSSLGEDFTGARLYRVRSGASERLDGGEQFPKIRREGACTLDSADPRHVGSFLSWARARYPARHTMLMLYGHADGRAMCPDEATGHEMGFAELTERVPAELSVNLMALELCYMGGVEIAYQWRPGNGGFSTQFLVSIPNAGPPLDWGRVFARLRTGAAAAGLLDPAQVTPEALGALIIEEGGKGREALAERIPDLAEMLGAEAVRCCDLSRVADVKRAVDALAVALANGDHREVFERAVRGPGEAGLVLNYSHGALFEDPFVDLHDLAVRTAGCEELPDGVRDAAAAVVTASNACVTASWGGAHLPRFVPGASGLSITCPASAEGWKRCRWYTPDELPLIWGRWAWCRDGATPGDGVVQNWFELLDAWFDAPSPEPGMNGYAW